MAKTARQCARIRVPAAAKRGPGPKKKISLEDIADRSIQLNEGAEGQGVTWEVQQDGPQDHYRYAQTSGEAARFPQGGVRARHCGCVSGDRHPFGVRLGRSDRGQLDPL